MPIRINAQHAQQHRVLRMIAALETVAPTPAPASARVQESTPTTVIDLSNEEDDDDVQIVGVTTGAPLSSEESEWDRVVRSVGEAWDAGSGGRGTAPRPTRPIPVVRRFIHPSWGAFAGVSLGDGRVLFRRNDGRVVFRRNGDGSGGGITGRGASNKTIAGLPTRTFPRKRKAVAMGDKKRKASASTCKGGGGGGAVAAGKVATRGDKKREEEGGSGTEEAGVALDSCCICMEDYKGGQKVCTLPCTHSFHFGCCKKWLKEHAICCVCRAPVSSAPNAAGGSGGGNGV